MVGIVVFKRISTKKTNTGYTVTIFFKDGAMCRPLHFGLERFFDVWDKQETGQTDLGTKKEFDNELERMKGAKVVDVR